MDKGKDFLHNHPEDEKRLGLDKDHVIVDRDAWEIAIPYFKGYVATGIADRIANKIIGKPKKRYFIVFYTMFGSTKVINTTFCDMVTDGEYVDRNEVSEKVLKEYNDRYDGKYSFHSLFITNIIELNESDYKDWVKTN